MSDTYFPPGGFYFTITVVGSGTALSVLTDVDASFQEVTGIQSERGIEEVTEGGENRFVHRLPTATRYSNLVLKRGVVTKASFLAEWVSGMLGSTLSLPLITQNLVVTLLDESSQPLVAWTFVNAYPVKWDISPMDSMDNRVLTETLEFAYSYFQRLNVGAVTGG